MPDPRARWERPALLLILLIGAWLRLQHPGAIELNVDQVYPIWQALQTLDRGAIPLAGQGTSVLFANPPLTGYLYLPLIALTHSAAVVLIAVILLNTSAIALGYRAVRDLLGGHAALIAALLIAVNPWIIEDSRRTWVQALAPFFVTFVFWALVPVLLGRTRHAPARTLIGLVALAVFAHTYLLAYALLAPAGLLILLFWRRVPRRALIAGAGVFAVLLTLYAAGLLREWDRTRARAEEFGSGQARLSAEALNHALRLVSGDGYADVRGLHAPQDDRDLRRSAGDMLHAAWVIALAVGALRAIRSAWRPRAPGDRDRALIVLIWCFVPVAMLSYVSRVVHPFYLLLSVPAGHALAAWGALTLAQAIPSRREVAARAALSLVLLLTAGINALNTVRFAQSSLAAPGEDLPETLPLGPAQTLARRLEALLGPGMVVISPLPEWTPAALLGRNLRAEQLTHTDAAIMLPRQGAITITFARDPSEPAPQPLGSTLAAAPLVLADHTVIAFSRTAPDLAPIAHPAAIPSDIDLSFAGWTAHGALQPGAEVALDLFWRVEALHPERGIWTFAPSVHLYDASGARIAMADGAVLSALTWQPGDVLLYRLLLRVPADSAGPYTLRASFFDSVRARPDGTPGINAIFRVPGGAETLFSPDFALTEAGAAP